MERPSPVDRAPGAERLALAAAALFLLAPTAALVPRGFGDCAEYYLTAESLLNHGSPALRGSDLPTMAARTSRQPVDGRFPTTAGYRRGRRGDLYAQHFWAYPAATLPVRLVLRRLGVHEYKAFAITNALMLLGAAWLWLTRMPYPFRWRLLGMVLLLASPIGWFVRLTHPEVFSASLVVAALAFGKSGAPVKATLAAALASLQNPPLVILAALLWAQAALSPAPGRQGRTLFATLAALVVALPFAFNLWAFGTPSLIADENIIVSRISAPGALELLLDLNVGLLPYAPLTVLLALAATAVGLARRGLRTIVITVWAALAAMALACTAMHDSNHGTSGPSRYTLWLFPLLVLIICEVLSRARGSVPALAAAMAAAAQLVVFVSRGGFRAPEDYLHHSWLARLVLLHRPALYAPGHEIFIERTAHRDWPGEDMDGPFVFSADGRCRKALAQKRHAEALRAQCGTEPAAFTEFVAEVKERGGGRGEWTYVDY